MQMDMLSYKLCFQPSHRGYAHRKNLSIGSNDALVDIAYEQAMM